MRVVPTNRPIAKQREPTPVLDGFREDGKCQIRPQPRTVYAERPEADDRNPVQGTRLAMCLVATGDSRGALSELQRATGAMPRDYRKQLLADTSAILWALVTQKPDLAGWQPVNDWLRGELAKLA